MTVEGVTQFTARHRHGLHRRCDQELLPELAAWRTVIAATGGIGQDVGRYDGAGYGNLSVRTGPFPGARGARAFLISSTQTGGLRCVGEQHFCRVERYNAKDNTVWSHGPASPSSESLTHGALYDLAPSLRAVVHVHAPSIFAAARALRLPETLPGVTYGTPAMAEDMKRLWLQRNLAEIRCFAMSGHDDGVIAIGRSLTEACTTLLQVHARSLALDFLQGGMACRST